MAKYQCPFCDFEDSEYKAVEAHISGKSNSSHKGKVGRMYRSEIRQDRKRSLREKVAGVDAENAVTASEIEQLRADIEEGIAEWEEQREELEQIRRQMLAAVQQVEEWGELIEVFEPYIFQRQTSDMARRLRELQRQSDESRECPHCGVESMLESVAGSDDWACPNCGKLPFSYTSYVE